MTDQEINIAIAEACGWIYSPYAPPEMKHCATACWFPPGYTGHLEQQIPSYTTDLNAMHEAEKSLSREELVDYCNFQLRCVTGEGNVEDYKIIRATAVQRAKAFVRTKGLWREAGEARGAGTESAKH